MKKLFNRVSAFVGTLDAQKIRMILMIAMLVLLVIGAGAPDDGGTIIHR